MGPITGEEGSDAGPAMGGSEGAVLQAATNAAAAPDTAAASQNRRGAAVKGSGFIGDFM